MAKCFSIRNPLQGELKDFLETSGFASSHVHSLVRDLTCLLAGYREEDVPLYPEVFVVPSSDTIASISPGTQRVPLRTVKLSDGAERILKDGASLAVSGWAIYVVVETGDNVAEYGVFRSRVHSFAMSAEETMTDFDETSPCLIIRNRGRLVVELHNTKQETFTATFTAAEATKSQLAGHVADFASVVSTSSAEDVRERFATYLARTLLDFLQHCHGTLLAAHVPPKNSEPPELLTDGVWLKDPLDLAGVYQVAVESSDAQSLAVLQAYESLLIGMIASDGVVVFGTNGTLLGYRVFLKPTEEEKKSLPDKGGGRRRTYALMEQRLGEQLKAALFRSQDGDTECRKAD